MYVVIVVGSFAAYIPEKYDGYYVCMCVLLISSVTEAFIKEEDNTTKEKRVELHKN